MVHDADAKTKSSNNPKQAEVVQHYSYNAYEEILKVCRPFYGLGEYSLASTRANATTTTTLMPFYTDQILPRLEDSIAAQQMINHKKRRVSLDK